jgi:cobalt/nickel transport system permease protein
MFKHGFIERSIGGVLSFFKNAIFTDEMSAAPGLLQSFDPRIKTVTILGFILLVMFTRNIAVLGAIYGLCLILAALSKIRLGFFLKRTWIFVPLFSLLIAIPALFHFASPGEPLLGTGAMSITRNGLRAAGFFIGRVITSVSLTILLSMTTSHFELLKVLRFFGIPQMFVMVLGISYRYIYLFVEMVENTYRAIKSRVGSRMHYRIGQRIVTWNIAYLWARSVLLNEQVYGAMLSRGFRGEPVALNLFQTKPRDWWWLLGSAVTILLLVYAEYRTGV